MRWQTRHLAYFIAATIPVKKNTENTLATAANKLTFNPKKTDRADGIEEFDPENPFGNRPEPVTQPGSYENFMSMFARPLPE